MWPCLYALCGGHETKKRLHFVLYVRQPHIKSQWGDVLFVNQREGEIHGKKKIKTRKKGCQLEAKQYTFILHFLKLYLILFQLYKESNSL